jgi:hypothetical protein
VLDPAKEDVKGKAYQGPTADPLDPPLPEKARDKREKDDSRENEVDNEDQIPCKPMSKERRKDHRAIGGEKIEQNVANQNKNTDLIKTPEVRAL